MSACASTLAGSQKAVLVPPPIRMPEHLTVESNGEIDQLVQTVEQNRRQLLWLAERITKDREEAEDIVQDSIIKALRNLHTFRGDAKIGTWLRVIVQNTAREWLRRRGGRVFMPLELARADDEDSGGIDLPDLGPTPEEWCQQKEITEMIQSELARLTLFANGALQMCSIEGRSMHEVAEALNLSVITIKSRIFRGKRLLRKRISRRLRGSERWVLG